MKQFINEVSFLNPHIDENVNETLPKSVLCRVRYPICNIDEMNQNKRIYEKAVWDKVLQDSTISEKVKCRVMFGESEHPVDETKTRLDRSISHIVNNIWLDESLKKVFAEIDIVDTPSGRIVNTLLEAGSQVGVSTRAEGELEEKIDETNGTYMRVIPESYIFETIDFTADPSTYQAIPISVDRNLARHVENGVKEGTLSKTSAVKILGGLRSKMAKDLNESLIKESGEKSAKDVVKADKVDVGDKDARVVVKAGKTGIGDKGAEDVIKVDVDEGKLDETESDVGVGDIVAVKSYGKEKGRVVKRPVSPRGLYVVQLKGEEEVKVSFDDLILEKVSEEMNADDTIETILESKDKLTGQEDQLKNIDRIEIKEEKMGIENVSNSEEKLEKLRKEYIKETTEHDELKKVLIGQEVEIKEGTESLKELKERAHGAIEKAEEKAKKLMEREKQLTKIVKQNISLEEDIKKIKKEKEAKDTELKQIKENKEKEFINRYVHALIRTSGYNVPKNSLTLLESCKSEEEVEALFYDLTNSLNESLLHSDKINEIRIEGAGNTTETNSVDKAVGSIMEHINPQ